MVRLPMVIGRGVPPEEADSSTECPPAREQARSNPPRGWFGQYRKAPRAVSHKQAKRNRALALTKAQLLLHRGTRCEGRLLYRGYFIGGRGSSAIAQSVQVGAALNACTGDAEELHHIAGRGFKGCDEPSNLLLLCRSCHQLATDSDPVAYLVGLSKYRNRVAS